jgi:undecaprenyl-diphosphatase
MLDTLLAADAAARLWLASNHTPRLDAVMLAASFVGRAGLVWLVLGTILWVLRVASPSGVWRMAVAIFIAGQLTDLVVKPAVARVRPFSAVMDVRVIGERPTTYSFPSGHAATAAAAAFALSRAWRGSRAFCWTLAAVIAFSRIYVGVHYPLDVLGGMLLGIAAAYFALGGPPVKAPPELQPAG